MFHFVSHSGQLTEICTQLTDLKRNQNNHLSSLHLTFSLTHSHSSGKGKTWCFRDDDGDQIFQSVYKQQMLMLEKLQTKKNKLDKKFKYIHAWRKVSSIIFVATFAAVLICSVVAAAMAAPPVVAALAAATSIPLGSMGKWIDSLLQNYENAIKGQKEIII